MASTPVKGRAEPRRPEIAGAAPPLRRFVRRDARVDADVLGIRRHPMRDLYFVMLSAPWWKLLALIAGIYVGVNAAFALLYLVGGGIEGAHPGSFQDAFFFSVQTMATIGYGAMHPVSAFANVLVTVQALLGLLGVAMATGVLFAKFARPVGQLVFSDVAVVNVREGVPSLMFRVANERINHVAEATMRVALVLSEKTVEGETFRRWHDLSLVRSYSPIFALTWTAIHPITKDSKLFGLTREALVAGSAEVIVTMTGLDATLAATIHARRSYVVDEIVWGGRFADILGVSPSGRRTVNFHEFHHFTVDEAAAERVRELVCGPRRAPAAAAAS